MVIEIGSFEAKNRLSELLAQAERGQRVYITRRGKRIAMLTRPDDDLGHPPDAERILGDFRAFRQRARTGPETLKALLEEGR